MDGSVGSSVDACMATGDCRHFGMGAIRKGFSRTGTEAEHKALTKKGVTRLQPERVSGFWAPTLKDLRTGCLPALSALPLLSYPFLSPSARVCPGPPPACPLRFPTVTLFRARSVCILLLSLWPFAFVSFGLHLLFDSFLSGSHCTTEET
jgi:hypothetical protein